MIRIAGIILVLVWSIPAWADGGDDLLDRHATLQVLAAVLGDHL